MVGVIGIAVAKKTPIEGGESTMEMLKRFNLYHVRLQLLWIASGLGLMALVVLIDYQVIANLYRGIYIIVLLMLVGLNIMGVVRGGAQSWFEIGPFGLQPSEFAKITMIIVFAKILAKDDEDDLLKTLKLGDYVKAFLYLIPPLVLIVLQPDFGTAMVFMVMLGTLLFIAGLSYKLLLSLVIAVGIAVPVVYNFLLDEYQQNRILVFLNPGADPSGKGYHVIQSKLAIGSGMITGKGLFSNNTLSQLDFLPEPHTDFIFSVTVEALGFAGGTFLILLYSALILRCIRIAKNSKDQLGSYMVIGVLAMIMAHIFENIGMTMGIMPITGIPLPFMSYGGSFMWTNMIAFGLVLNVDMRSQTSIFRREL
jgi:rod shape determining protein RodA